MKHLIFLLMIVLPEFVTAQIDPALLRRVPADTSGNQLNMDATYQRPFLQPGKWPLAIGGYVEGNYQYLQEDGVSEGHQFQFRRMTLFVSSPLENRLRLLSEIEFEDGAREINIEFASIDMSFSPLVNLRAGILMNPIGAFNQNHDGPKWEFVDRPLSATELLPATFSTVGAGVYGKKYRDNLVFGYEAYLSNGFDDRIISNTQNKTFLPATKENPDRFEESFNGSMLLTTKVAARHEKIGEVGLSMMRGVYNRFREDGLTLDRKRRVQVFAVDANHRFPATGTSFNLEWCWIDVDIPSTYTEQFGRRQQGGFIDIVQPVYKRPLAGFEQSSVQAALRVEFVDWNKGKFSSTGSNIRDELFAIVPALSWRPLPSTVFRLNYRYSWQKDLLGNPATRRAGFQFGFSTYF